MVFYPLKPDSTLLPLLRLIQNNRDTAIVPAFFAGSRGR